MPVLRLATVVTPGWSGVMDELISRFEQAHQIRVDMFSGFDIYERAENGDADMVISHYKKDDGRSSMKRFVMTGQGHWPKMLFSNREAIIGPSADPAGIRGERSAAQALRRIAESGQTLFVSSAPQNIFTVDLLQHAAGGEAVEGRDWMAVGGGPHGGGDGSKVIQAYELGHYLTWGLVPFLKWKERNPNVTMEAMVWEDQILSHAMASVVVKQEVFPYANVQAALLFEKHILSAESQAHIYNFRMPGIDAPVWLPRAMDNIGHPFFPAYPGEDSGAENFTSMLTAECANAASGVVAMPAAYCGSGTLWDSESQKCVSVSKVGESSPLPIILAGAAILALLMLCVAVCWALLPALRLVRYRIYAQSEARGLDMASLNHSAPSDRPECDP